MGAILIAQVLRILAEILSGLEALLVSNEFMSFSMPSTVNSISGIEENGESAHQCKSVKFSWSKTDY